MLKEVLTEIIKKNVNSDVFEWLKEKSTSTGAQFNTAFVALPRKTGKKIIELTEEENKRVGSGGLHINNWSIDRLSRVWLLMHLDASDKEKYFNNIEALFTAGEMNELIALYSALPVLQYPELWKKRCAEGIRNNIADVLQSIMCNNTYPSQNLDEPAWNQLVLKAFFTEKPIEQIIGFDERANEKLASTLYDFAHERLSAHRTVDPQLWRGLEPFADEKIFPDIKKIKDYVLQQ